MQLKTLLGAALLLLAGAAQAQTIPETTPEPEFIGEIVTEKLSQLMIIFLITSKLLSKVIS